MGQCEHLNVSVCESVNFFFKTPLSLTPPFLNLENVL